MVVDLVGKKGQTACDVLALKPATDVNELVDLILSTCVFESMDADSQRVIVAQFMSKSAEARGPEQTDRISAELHSGQANRDASNPPIT